MHIQILVDDNQDIIHISTMGLDQIFFQNLLSCIRTVIVHTQKNKWHQSGTLKGAFKKFIDS